MFKTTLKLVLAMLCLNFSLKATAQTPKNQPIEASQTGLQIGQKVPDVTITYISNYKDTEGQPVTIAKLSYFKGKLLILDFWDTLCSPCVAMLPKMDFLQQQFKDKIQFLSLSNQSAKYILPMITRFEKQQKRFFDLPMVTSEKELHKLFSYENPPHYVWIDQTGIVKAITGEEEITAAHIEKMLQAKRN